MIDIDALNLESPEIEADGGGFKNVDEGKWRFRVVTAAPDKGKTSGRPNIKLGLEVVAKADGSDAGKNAGRRTFMWLNPYVNPELPENSKRFQLGRLKAQLVALRYPLSGVLNPDEFVNREFTAKVTHNAAAPRVDDDGNEIPSDRVFANLSEEQPV